MQVAHTSDSQASTTTTTYFLLLLLLFAGSGCSALIYEIAWYQTLQLALGSTSISLGFLLLAFMGGLCLGSILLPRIKLQGVPALHVYASLEFGIAILGLAATIAIPLLSRVYFAISGPGLQDMLLRGLIAAAAMLPPTILMGASLPALVRGIEVTPRGVSWWAILYGGNTAGAVVGCLFAGFYLLRLYNTAAAGLFAAALNVVVAVAALWLSGRAPAVVSRGIDQPEHAPSTAPIDDRAASRWPIYLSIAISGMCALGAEVLWTRLMGMLLLGTVYVFSVILATFLIGLAVGGTAASRLIRMWIDERARLATALGWCQVLLTAAILWTGLLIARVLPFMHDDVLITTNPAYLYLLDFKRCLLAILPPSLLWGASFPLACAAALRSRDEDPARVTGGIYAANTLGAIVGALAVSLVLVPWIGTQQTLRLLIVFSAIAAIPAFLPPITQGRNLFAATGLISAVVLAIIVPVWAPATPGELIAYGRRMAQDHNQSEILYTAEGRNSSVAISRWQSGIIDVNVNGHIEATTLPFDMRLQRMVGHLPAMIHPNPKSVLGIGFGAGVSAGTFTRYPSIEKISICEIEPVIPPASTRYFADVDYSVYHNPKTRMIYDDARHYLMTTKEKYDIIASDPLDVFIKGTAALYSEEYFETVKSRLNPGGMFSLYVPLYESDANTVKSELATFFEAFPNGTVWTNTREGQGYDMVLMGQAEPLRVDLDEMNRRLGRPDYAPVAISLHEVGIGSVFDLFGSFAGQKADLSQWTADAEISRDSNLRLSYLAGFGINNTLADTMYREMLRYRQSPKNLFTGSPQSLQALENAMYSNSEAGE